MAVEVFSNGKGHLGTQDHIALHAGTAQVKIAVLEASFLADVADVFHGEGRGLRLIEDPDLVDHHFNFAGGQVRVDGVGGALFDEAGDADDVFGAQVFGAGMGLGEALAAEDELRRTFAIAQVDEDDAAQIAAAMDPAHQQHALANVFEADGAAIVRAFEVTEEVKLNVRHDYRRRASNCSRDKLSCSPVAMFLTA